jgi:putative ABC transport system substrate-binding protein
MHDRLAHNGAETCHAVGEPFRDLPAMQREVGAPCSSSHEFRILAALVDRQISNATGVTIRTTELVAKRLELLHEIVPAVTLMGFLGNPTNSQVEADVKEAQVAARTLGLNLVTFNASTPSEIEAAFAILAARRVGALMLMTDSFFTSQRVQLAALAARHSVPAIYNFREFVEDGGLMSYGANFPDAWRLAGTYVGRILKGEKAADLPVQQSTRFEMVLNLKVAKALGIEGPTATLLRATEVIE